MGDQYKVYYFNSRGLAEPMRIILSYGDVKFEDIRIPLTPPKNVVPDDIKARSPYGQVPLLEYNGQIIAQSQAASRFLAIKFNLVGSNELESAKCDEVVDATKDFVTLWLPYFTEQDEAKKAEIKKKAAEDSKTRFLSKFNEILEGNGGHFVGKGLTWADIYVAHFVDSLSKIMESPLVDDFPAIQKLITTVYETPRIKEWIESRPVTQF